MKKPSVSLIIALACSTLWIASGQAATLLDENFNYGGSSGAIGGTASGGGAFGITGNYAATLNSGATANYDSTGLSFTGLSSSGGSLAIATRLDGNTGISIGSAGVALDTGTVTGDTWVSFLYRLNVNTINQANARVGVGFTDSAASTVLAQTRRMTSWTRSSGSLRGPTRVAYEGTESGSNYAASAVAGTTYFGISKFTNVGGAGGGDATLWTLDETDYADWQTAGGTEATLDANSFTKAFASDPDPITLSDSNFLNFYVNSNSNPITGQLSGTFDRIMIGTDLASAVVPEPAAVGLLSVAGLFGLLLNRPRRNRG